MMAKPPKNAKPKNQNRRANKSGETTRMGVRVQGAPTNVATNVFMNASVEAQNQYVFPFQECIGPNCQTTSLTAIGGTLVYGDATGTGLQPCNWDVNPTDTISFGTRFTNEAGNWEFFRITELIIEWIPFKGTQTDGQVIIAYDYDPLGATPPQSTEGYRTYTQYRNVLAGSVWEPMALRCKVDGSKIYPVERFFTDMNKSADARQAIQGQIYLVHGGGLAASTKFGQLWIKGKCVFTQRSYRNPATGAGVQGATITYPIAGAAGQNALALPGAVYTSNNADTAFVAVSPDGQNAIFLAPGTYISDMSTFLAPSVSNAAGALQFGTSSLQQTTGNVTGELAEVIPRRSDFSTVAASALAQSFAASRQEVISVPFGGTWYRPLVNNPAYAGVANTSTMTINLIDLATSAIGLISGLFADPIGKIEHDKALNLAQLEYFNKHGNMIGFELPKWNYIPDVLNPLELEFVRYLANLGINYGRLSSSEIKCLKGSWSLMRRFQKDAQKMPNLVPDVVVDYDDIVIVEDDADAVKPAIKAARIQQHDFSEVPPPEALMNIKAGIDRLNQMKVTTDDLRRKFSKK